MPKDCSASTRQQEVAAAALPLLMSRRRRQAYCHLKDHPLFHRKTITLKPIRLNGGLPPTADTSHRISHSTTLESTINCCSRGILANANKSGRMLI